MPIMGSGHWLVECITLFFATFVHEDVALVAGAAYIVEDDMPWPLALLGIYLGILTGDIALYALGSLAGRIQRLRRLVISDKVELVHRWLDEHLVVAIAVCRLIPGLLFPTFVACGWFGVSLKRFLAMSVVTSAIYTSVMLVLLTYFGGNVLHPLSYWAWIVIGMMLIGFTALRAVWPRWDRLAQAASYVNSLKSRTMTRWRRHIVRISHVGMPPIGLLYRKASIAERLPPFLFYLPLALQWLALSIRYRSLTLPTVTNPSIETGGFWGESKSACMRLVAPEHRKWLADFTTIVRSEKTESSKADVQAALAAIASAKLEFPLVAKPDIGWRGYGVQLIKGEEQLSRYIGQFPTNETIILQRYIPYDGEAGVFYVRIPGEERGSLLSLTFRYFPHVVGNGEATLAQLILRDPRACWKASLHLGTDRWHLGFTADELERIPDKGTVVRLSFIGSNRVGGLYRDARQYITPALTARFDEISRSMPEFYFGRFDVRFRSIENFQKGEELATLEINGAGSEAIHVWDPEMPIIETYRGLFHQQALAFAIGDRNRMRGFQPTGPIRLLRCLRRQRQLIKRYPPSS